MKHIAIIMDGNGRWAKERGLKRAEGHKAGAKTLASVIECACEEKIPFLTLYALSRENLQRPDDEVKQLFSLLSQFLSEEVANLLRLDISLHCIGDIDSLPFASQQALKFAIDKTKDCKGMKLAIALVYSGREEIARACQRLDKEKSIQNMSAIELAQNLLGYLDAPSFPEPDMIIRTGGDQRISNFLLFQAAYSEFYFSELYFPDFQAEEFKKALEEFKTRTRRFGKTDEQI